jgi:hypothetical protein
VKKNIVTLKTYECFKFSNQNSNGGMMAMRFHLVKKFHDQFQFFIRKIQSLLLVLVLFYGTVGYAQLYQGPATGSIPGGASVSTGSFDSAPAGQPPNSVVIPNRTVDLLDDKYNSVLPSAPAGSNVIIDPGAAVFNSNPTAPGLVNDFNGIGMTGFIPPDPHVAVGPNHIVATVNTSFAIFDKSGNKLHQITANAWFSNVLSGAAPGDPQIVYDHHSERWFMVWHNTSGPISLLLSMSDDSDPNGTWCNWRIPGDQNGPTFSGLFNDYPKIGVDKNAIYVTANMFSTNFQYARLRIIPKAQLLDNQCGPLTWTDLWDLRFPSSPGNRVFTAVPAVTFDTTDSQYLINSSNFITGTFVTLWTLNNPISNPTMTAVDIPVTQYSSPPNAGQLGGGTPINTQGYMFRNAVVRDGSIWTAHNIAGGAGNSYGFARYLRMDVQTKAVIEDLAFGANNYWYYFPAITVDRNHNMTMCFTRSGYSEYPGARFTGRLVNDPTGLAPSALLKEGLGNYVVIGGGSNRWGDYMGIALDPSDDVIWSLVEYAAGTNTWGTWIGGTTHKYMTAGIVRDGATQNPVEFAHLEVAETGRMFETDSTGSFAFGSTVPNVTVHVNAFAYQDTSVSLALTAYIPDTTDIFLLSEIEATISGQVKDSVTGSGILAELEFYAHGNPYPGPYITTTTDANGFYNVTTIIGDYDVVVSPEIPYPVTTINNVSLSSSSLTLDIELLPADILLVNDDTTAVNETYFQDALDALNVSYFTWRVSEDGIPDANTFALFPDPKTVIWYTGNAATAVLSDPEQQSLAGLLDNGGRLLLTGQNIAETSSGGVLLTNYLGASFNTNISPPLVRGVAGDIIGDGLLLSSVGGAGNQISKDALLVTGNADSVLYYGVNPLDLAAIKAEDTQAGWRAVFTGFGLEGINNTAGSRDELLRRILGWFGVTVTGIENEPGTITNIPQAFELKQNYPNPFNPETTIEFAVPQNTRVEITIFNLLGQQVRALVNDVYPAGTYNSVWDGRNDIGEAASSGAYFYRMSTQTGFQSVKKLLLLK